MPNPYFLIPNPSSPGIPNPSSLIPRVSQAFRLTINIFKE